MDSYSNCQFIKHEVANIGIAVVKSVEKSCLSFIVRIGYDFRTIILIRLNNLSE